MNIHPETPTTSPQPPLAIHLWALCGAVAIRLTVPVVLLVLAGIYLDKRLATLPLLTISAIPVSFLISIYLVKRDLMHLSFVGPKKDKKK
jgi:hypothetical protein